jgi:hypothetical protein
LCGRIVGGDLKECGCCAARARLGFEPRQKAARDAPATACRIDSESQKLRLPRNGAPEGEAMRLGDKEDAG